LLLADGAGRITGGNNVWIRDTRNHLDYLPDHLRRKKNLKEFQGIGAPFTEYWFSGCPHLSKSLEGRSIAEETVRPKNRNPYG
jgi:hypothetical protein